MKFKKIVILGDSKRPVLDQVGNITRFYWSLKAQLEYMFELDVECLIDDNRVELEDWINFYNPRYSNDNVWFSNKVDQETLVLSWELPYNHKAWLKNNKIKHIDFITYPLNLWSGLDGDNPVYGVDLSPSKGIFGKKIGDLKILRNIDIQIQANKLKAKYAKKDRIPVPENTALVVGQTPIDRSLIDKHGNLVNIENYKEHIKNIVNRHNHVLFKAHPNDWQLGAKTELMQSLGCEIYKNEKWNTYDLLSEPKITSIYGISSSCLNEAKNFDKKKIFRFDNTYSDYVFSNYLHIFWKDIQNLNWWFLIKEILDET